MSATFFSSGSASTTIKTSTSAAPRLSPDRVVLDVGGFTDIHLSARQAKDLGRALIKTGKFVEKKTPR